MNGTELPLVLVLVGTDHHSFDRLVAWVDDWTRGRLGTVRVVVQRGTSVAPTTAHSVDYLDHADLQSLMEEAAVVVSHGGPTGIAESRRHGTVPVVVPRDPAFNEHVDAHQIRFTRRLAEEGLVLHAQDREDLAALLDKALADPETVRVVHGDVDEVERSSERFGIAVAALFDPSARRVRHHQPAQVDLRAIGSQAAGAGAGAGAPPRRHPRH